jgi:hypothetical protein
MTDDEVEATRQLRVAPKRRPASPSRAQLDAMAIERVHVALDVLRTDNAPRVGDGYMSESTTGHVRALAAHR